MPRPALLMCCTRTGFRRGKNASGRRQQKTRQRDDGFSNCLFLRAFYCAPRRGRARQDDADMPISAERRDAFISATAGTIVISGAAYAYLLPTFFFLSAISRESCCKFHIAGWADSQHHHESQPPLTNTQVASHSARSRLSLRKYFRPMTLFYRAIRRHAALYRHLPSLYLPFESLV